MRMRILAIIVLVWLGAICCGYAEGADISRRAAMMISMMTGFALALSLGMPALVQGIGVKRREAGK